ncbi:MAG: PAS domain S-box protein, partial [Cyclobacteriaceae bacterium]
ILMLGTDITEKKLVLEKLSLVANNTDNSVMITNKYGRIEYVNDGFANLTGYSAQEVIDRNPDSMLHGPKTDAHTVKRIHQQLKEGVPFNEEVLNYKKNKESFWVSLVVNPIRNESGEVERYVSIQTDITKMKETALDYTHKLEAISKSNAVVEFDRLGFVANANPMYLEITGYQEEELLGKSYFDLVPLDELEKPQTRLMWENLKSGTFFSGEFRQKSRQGQELWLNGTFNPIFDLDNNLHKIMMFAQFTTREKETQQELMGTIQALNNAVLTIEMDAEGNLKKANERFLKLFGYKRLEMSRKKLSDLVPEGSTLPEINEVLQTASSDGFPISLLTKTGETHHYRGSFTQVWGLEGKLSKIVLVLLEDTLKKVTL